MMPMTNTRTPVRSKTGHVPACMAYSSTLLADIIFRQVALSSSVCFPWQRFDSTGSVLLVVRRISAGLPTIGDLTKWENVGKPTVVADLLKQRRDSDAGGGGQVESVVLPGATVDGDVLQVSSKRYQRDWFNFMENQTGLYPQAVGHYTVCALD